MGGNTQCCYCARRKTIIVQKPHFERRNFTKEWVTWAHKYGGPERSQRLHFALETQAAIQCRRTHARAHTKKGTAWVHAWQQAVRRFYGQHGSRFGNMWHIKEPAATDCTRRSLSSTRAREAASQQKAPRRHNRSTHIDERLNSRLQSWVKAELWCPRVWDVAPSNGEKAQYSFILF